MCSVPGRSRWADELPKQQRFALWRWKLDERGGDYLARSILARTSLLLCCCRFAVLKSRPQRRIRNCSVWTSRGGIRRILIWLRSCGPTVDQLRSGFLGDGACKCDTRKALDFSTLQFGTRRSMVQIHSPRPFLRTNNLPYTHIVDRRLVSGQEVRGQERDCQRRRLEGKM